MTESRQNITIQYSRFLADLENRQGDWRLQSCVAAVKRGFGTIGVLKYVGCHLLALLPSALFAVYAVYSARYSLLGWPVLGLLGYLAGNPAPSGIGVFLQLIFAATGLVLSLVHFDQVYFLGGLLPGLAWFAACAVYGTTTEFVLELLRRSPQYFQALFESGILVSVEDLQADSAPENAQQG